MQESTALQITDNPNTGRRPAHRPTTPCATRRSSPSAATRIRQTIDAATQNTFSEQLDLEMVHQGVLIPRNMQEGARAFMEKRPPEFDGKRD